MAIEPTYATREQVAAATDTKSIAQQAATIDRHLAAASRGVERLLNRRFYPLAEAKAYRLTPGGNGLTGFWLERDLIALSALTVDGESVDPDDITLTPVDGPPFSGIDYRGAGSEVVVTGLWGYSNDEAAAGALAANATSGATTVTVSDAGRVGVGDLLRIDAERMVVTGRDLVPTGAALAAAVAANTSTTAILLDDGAKVHAGETITIDAERMTVIDVAGDTLVVKRAVDGSVLAAHDLAAEVHAPRALTVARGAAGTNAASHSSGALVARSVPPGLVTELVAAETIAAMGQAGAGWSRTAGSGDNERPVSGEGLEQLRKQAMAAYRRARLGRAV